MVGLLKKKRAAADIVAEARSPKKITATEIINNLFPDFFELHGDRLGEDDPAIIGGLAYFNGQAVTVIAIDKGTSPEERIAKHFGSPTPGGYRKTLRLIKQAEKFNRPILAFINTAGAYPGRSAEEGGQGEAIAKNLLEISAIKVPLISVIFGEGGSGGALALACGDQVWMFENSMYSVLSPEGFASILWKDSQKAGEAAEIMQLTPENLLKQGIIEGIIAEGGSQRRICKNLNQMLNEQLPNLMKLSTEELLAKRYARFRKF
jgi:acetyl-CoA carboxylase carboxyl transferase subunit alpha